MNQTAKNIKRYKSMLPRMRERVIAMVTMLAISASLMVSVSFAWVTLSTNPSLEGISTTITGNGSLEIALSPKDGTEPGSTSLGDSMASPDKNVDDANRTWGNLIDLSDPSYGLDKLQLRPAELNKSNLLQSPIQGVIFGDDGRVQDYLTKFSYASYDQENDIFRIPDRMEYGVRSVSSATFTTTVAQQNFEKLVSAASLSMGQVEDEYVGVFENKTYIEVLGGLVSRYVSSKLSSGDELDCSSYVGNLNIMAKHIYSVYGQLADAYGDIAYLQQYKKFTDETKCVRYTGEELFGDYAYIGVKCAHCVEATDWANLGFKSADRANVVMCSECGTYQHKACWETNGGCINKSTGCANATPEAIYTGLSSATLQAQGISLTEFQAFKNDYATLSENVAKINSMNDRKEKNGEKIYWTELSAVVDYLVKTNTVTINGKTVSEIASNLDISALKDSTTVVNSGFLYRLDARMGRKLDVKGMKVTVLISSITTNVRTAAYTGPSHAREDLDDAKRQDNFTIPEDAVAQDTYALALDFWVRCNAPYEYLILETEGANRIWQDYIDATGGQATTQGAGSCYVFTCENPSDYERTLKLLEAFTITFFGDDGNVMAHAVMDTANVKAISGRYSVPLKIKAENTSQTVSVQKGYNTETKYFDTVTGNELTKDEGSDQYYYVDDSGARVEVPASQMKSEIVNTTPIVETYDYITLLEQSVAKRITALVYLDGSKMTNDLVNAAADIQGKLNIQFAGVNLMQAMEDDILYKEYMGVSASADRTSMDFDSLAEGEKLPPVKVTVNIRGDLEPNRVSGYFLRAVNATQGARQELMNFKQVSKTEDGSVWEFEMQFDAPGTYKLMYITVNGREYALPEPVVVEVAGFAMGSISWDLGDSYASVLTGDKSLQTNLTFSFMKNDVKAHSVRALFMEEDGTQVSVTMRSNDGTQWTGRATFNSSGKYKLTYIYVDNEAYAVPIPETEAEQKKNGLHKILDLRLGVTANVWIASPAFVPGTNSFLMEKVDDEHDYSNGAPMNVNMNIVDEYGAVITDVQTVTLNYINSANSMDKPSVTMTINDSGMYVGSFQIENPGIFKFHSVELGSSVISKASFSPVITAISPEPPAYAGVDTTNNRNLSYQFVPKTSATIPAFYVNVANTGSAQFKAKVVNTNDPSKVYQIVGSSETLGKTIRSGSAEADVTTWTFDLRQATLWGTQTPIDSVDGNWKLVEIHASNFMRDGQWYAPEGDDAMWEVWSTSQDSIQTIQEMNIKFVENIYVYLNNTPAAPQGSFTGVFMTSHVVDYSGFSVKICDFEGKPFDAANTGGVLVLDQTTVDLKFQFTNTTDYYTHNWGTDSYGDRTLTATVANGMDVTFAEAAEGSMDFKYAGEYTPNLKFVIKINGVNTDYAVYSGNSSGTGIKVVGTKLPTYKTEWSLPTVEFSSLSTSQIALNVTSSGPWYNKKYTWTYDSTGTYTNRCVNGDTEVNVYLYPYEVGDVTLGSTYTNITPPTVSATLSGMGTEFTNAVCTLEYPSNEGYSTVMTFTGNTTLTGVKFGASANANGIAGQDIFYTPNGALAEDIVVTGKDGSTYTIKLTKSIRIVSFTSNREGYGEP